MNWTKLEDQNQLLTINEESKTAPVAIFKHSTQCNISEGAKQHLDGAENGAVKAYYLDLLQYRSISNAIAEEYGVQHKSPQLLIIKDGKCSFSESHGRIDWEVAMGEVG